MRLRTVVFVLIAVVVGLYYRWGVRAAGAEFRWGQNIDGYYDLLARGFAAGHLYLPVEVSPELLAKPNPYDPAIADSLKLFDAALYNQRYYLYHGAGPAVMLFLPWRLVTRHDLPENYAGFLFCFGGWLFSVGALFALLRLAAKEQGPVVTGLLAIGLAFCQSVPFLLNRIEVYEIAIAGGYFCISAAVYFALRGLATGNRKWLAACGLACGLAIACRPHLGLFAVALGLLVVMRARRCVIAFMIPLALAALAIATYNYERFGSPTEFGIRYLLTGKNQNRVKLDADNIRPASYYLLAAPPQTGKMFPWLRAAWPPEDIPRPKEFFLEPSVGAIWLAPFLPAIFFLPMLGRARLPVILLTAAAAGVCLFLVSTGWSTQRYDIDFLPILVLCSLASAAAVRNPFVRAAMAVLIVAGTFVNLALAVTGPVDEMIQNRPDRYVRLSRMLTPIGRYALRLNPPFTFVCPIAQGPAGQMILSLGSPLYRYELLFDGRNLVSRRFGSEVKSPAANIRDVTVTFVPASLEIVVSEAGNELLRHRLSALTAASVELEAACNGHAIIPGGRGPRAAVEVAAPAAVPAPKASSAARLDV